MLKRIISLLLLTGLLFVFSFGSFAVNDEIKVYMGGIQVFIDGTKLVFPVAPYFQDSYTMVPMRPIFEALGANVVWNAESRTVTATRNNHTVSLTLNSRTAMVNGEEITLDVAPRIANNVTFVPLRFVSEALNAQVNWDSESRTVRIYRYPGQQHEDSAAPHTPVVFKDPELLAAVLNQLGKPAGPVYRSELAAMTVLEAGDHFIEDLTGLEYCTGLTVLVLNNNFIVDLTPLSGLQELSRLELGYNQVIDLKPLAGLTGLTWLALNNNRVVDLWPLAGLTALEWVTLNSNDVQNITPLSSLENLSYLNISNNNIRSIEALAPLQQLVTLSMWNNGISDLYPLGEQKYLTTINAWSNQISDLGPLLQLVNLTWVVLGDNPLDMSAGTLTSAQVRKMRGRGVYVRTDFYPTGF